MTENKRFTVKQRQGATIYSIIDYYGELPLSEGMYYKSNAEKLCKWLNTQHELLNAFCKENEQLQTQLSQLAKSNREGVKKVQSLAKENEQLKQFQDRVFSWIDMHLQRLPTLRDDEFESDNEFADPSLYNGAIQILETMKKELKGDVE